MTPYWYSLIAWLVVYVGAFTILGGGIRVFLSHNKGDVSKGVVSGLGWIVVGLAVMIVGMMLHIGFEGRPP